MLRLCFGEFLAFQDLHELVAGDGLLLIQVLGQFVRFAAVFGCRLFGLRTVPDQLDHGGVDAGLGLGRAAQRGVAAQVLVLYGFHGNHAKILVHTIAGDHSPGQLGSLLNVVGGTGGDGVKYNLLRQHGRR